MFASSNKIYSVIIKISADIWLKYMQFMVALILPFLHPKCQDLKLESELEFYKILADFSE